MDMRDLAAIAPFVAILAPPLIGLFFVARWFAHRGLRSRPSAIGSMHVTPTGYVLYGFQTVLLFVGLAVRELQPHASLGQFLQSPMGLVTYIVCLIIGVGIAERALGKLGYPPIRKRSGDYSKSIPADS